MTATISWISFSSYLTNFHFEPLAVPEGRRKTLGSMSAVGGVGAGGGEARPMAQGRLLWFCALADVCVRNFRVTVLEGGAVRSLVVTASR